MMPNSLEESLKELENFLKISNEEFQKVSTSIDKDGVYSTDKSLPVFVNTSDFINTKIDPFEDEFNLSDEEKKLRESILASRQLLSELGRAVRRI